jgi:uncharacterized protein (TIGR01244 family)
MTMWPFKADPDRGRKVNYRKIDNDYAVTGQITPEQLEAVAAAGFKTIICARPDGEEPGQPTFATIERAAKAKGLKAAYIPISGGIGEGALIRMEDALKTLPRPMLGYCRSGARAGSLYGAALQAARR